MFHAKKIEFEPRHRQAIGVGLILLLLAAIIALLVLLHYYFASQLAQVQNVTLQNNQRIAQIENYLNSLDQQARQQSQQKLMEDLGTKK